MTGGGSAKWGRLFGRPPTKPCPNEQTRSVDLGLASGHTIWLDDNAAGWGWFVDATPWDDSEFTTPGNQGEQHRMDLLSVVRHEMGHLLGLEHVDEGVMAETLSAGTRPGSIWPFEGNSD